MKKIILIVIIAFVIVGGISFFFLHKELSTPSEEDKFQKISYELEGKKYTLLVADNPILWEKGLMYFRTLKKSDGMIFIFPAKMAQTFWNKNTLMNLKLYWIDDDKVIGTSDMPSIEKSNNYIYLSSPGPVNKVIEMVKK